MKHSKMSEKKIKWTIDNVCQDALQEQKETKLDSSESNSRSSSNSSLSSSSSGRSETEQQYWIKIEY